MNRSRIWSTADIGALYLLFAAVLLAQLQVAFPGLAALRLREVLYLYLYARVFFIYPLPRNSSFIFLSGYLICAGFVAVLTFYLHGSELALPGLMRFISIALIAPLISTVVGSRKEVRVLIGIWLSVIAGGAATAVYQFFGGKWPALVQDYVANRGGIIRYKTILGEPNIGGMASAIALVFAILWSRKLWSRGLNLFMALVLAVLSVSKSALLGAVISIIIAVFSRPRFFESPALARGKSIRLKRIGFSLVVIIALGWAALGTQSSVVPKLRGYVESQVKGFLGLNSDGGGIVDDLALRLVRAPARGFDRLLTDDAPLLAMFLGGGYGLAGSKASEFDDTAMMPHNGIVEIVFVGGIVLAFFFVGIIVAASGALADLGLRHPPFLALFGAFWLTVLYNFTYPVIYAPVIGGMLWLTIGIAANSRIRERNS